ncbi:MAG: hypothetical protein ACOC46_03355, partial [Pirellulales bacterium]
MTSPVASPHAEAAPSTTARRVGFRVAAVLLGLALLAAAELALVAFDAGRPDRYDDPYVGFSGVYPLFVRSDDGEQWVTSPARRALFQPDSFAAEKPADEFRIFVLGGSTVQGRPYSIPTSFTTWLEIRLNCIDPRRRWQVVNVGGVSYASYRLVPLMEEMLTHEPDLFIVYTGHNEFLEDRSYAHIKDRPAWWARLTGWMSRLRSVTLLRRLYGALGGRSSPDAEPSRTVLGPEVDAWLDHPGGLDAYHRDDAWRRGVISHFRFNLRRMVDLVQGADVPLVLVNPTSNVRDWAPFKSEHRAGLSEAQRRRWDEHLARARAQMADDLPGAIEQLRAAARIDDQHAGLWFTIAKCYDGLGDIERARTAYLKAKDFDICPLRMLEPMHEAVLEVAADTETPLVDARRLFQLHS